MKNFLISPFWFRANPGTFGDSEFRIAKMHELTCKLGSGFLFRVFSDLRRISGGGGLTFCAVRAGNPIFARKRSAKGQIKGRNHETFVAYPGLPPGFVTRNSRIPYNLYIPLILDFPSSVRLPRPKGWFDCVSLSPSSASVSP